MTAPEGTRSSQAGDLEPGTLHVHNRDSLFHVSPSDILHFFWASEAERCEICDGPFDAEQGASIRTFSGVFEDDDGDDKINHIRLHDRHRKCIADRRLEYIAVSHVWHEPVRTAHESGQSNPEAAALVRRAPLKMLGAASRAFGRGAEVWHDYLSVPQWRYETQQQILLLIPDIYHMPVKIFVHLEDYPPKHIQMLLDFTPILDANPETLEKMEERYEAVLAFYQTRWMRRVWVTLEHARSKRACLVDSDHRVWRGTDTPYGSFVHLYDECRRNYIMVFNHFLDRRVFLESVRYVSRGQDSYFAGIDCMGAALDTLATRDCKYYRDRFIAIHASLAKDVYETHATDVPKDDAGACRWVWTRALERGDYSPLLLQPNGNREKEALGLSWLVGHEMMNFYTWDLGLLLSPCLRPTIMRDGDVRPELDCIGIVSEVHHIPLGDDVIQGLGHIITLFMQLPDWTVPEFVSTLERIYPVLLFCTRYAAEGNPAYKKVPMHLEDYTSSNPNVEASLDQFLRKYQDASQRDDEEGCKASANDIAELLQLNARFGPMSNDTRLRDAMKRARHRRNRDGGADETICTVTCEKCQKRGLFKLDLRLSAPSSGARLYRIPGLSFTMTLENGVGLVIADGRVVGRTGNVTSMCLCESPELVSII